MPDQPLDPIKALLAIRTLTCVALETDDPKLHVGTLREILQACENALPPRRRVRAKPPTP